MWMLWLGCASFFQDGDGDGVSVVMGDCDDGDPAIHPGADELCNGIDDDCDGTVDGPEALDGGVWFIDLDGDGWGEEAVFACEWPGGTVELGGDCWDGDPDLHPGVDEHCDGVDEDCDGQVDEDATDAFLWVDEDGDGFGTELSCEGTAYAGEDCDDEDPSAFPAAPEVCDGADNDCDGEVDVDAVDATTWYADRDGDGYGDPLDSLVQCEQPSGYIPQKGDCDDSTAEVTTSCRALQIAAEGTYSSNTSEVAVLYEDGSVEWKGVVYDEHVYTDIGLGDGWLAMLTSDGAVVQVGAPYTTTGWTHPPSQYTYAELDADSAHGCAVTTDGDVVRWGTGRQVVEGVSGHHSPDAAHTQCATLVAGGIGNWEGFSALSPLDEPGLKDIDVAASSGNRLVACAIRSDDTLTCSGNPWDEAAKQPPSGTYVEVETGWQGGCAVPTSGEGVVCWGVGSYVATAPTTGSFSGLAISYERAFAINADGEVVSW